VKGPQHYIKHLKITLLVLLWYNSDLSFRILGYRYLNRAKFLGRLGGGPRPPSKYAHACMHTCRHIILCVPMFLVWSQMGDNQLDDSWFITQSSVAPDDRRPCILWLTELFKGPAHRSDVYTRARPWAPCMVIVAVNWIEPCTAAAGACSVQVSFCAGYMVSNLDELNLVGSWKPSETRLTLNNASN